MDKEVYLGIYKHYKGFYVQTIAVGEHTETEERLVAYVPLSIETLEKRGGPAVSMRPLENFFEEVENENGEKVKRFEYVGHVKK